MTPPKLANRRLRAALYGRVSLDVHGNSPSPERQNSVGEIHCDRNDWINAGVYGAGDRSASRKSKKVREDWARLLDDIRAGRIDVVIVWEWSRADRNPTTGFPFLDLCEEFGILIHVASKRGGKGKTYDVKDDRDDWKELAHELVDNAAEVDKIVVRTTDARRDRIEKGIVDGAIAYGYRRVYDPNTRVFIRQEADPATAKIVREIIRRVVAGEPITVITNDLTARKVPTPKGGKTWCRSTVRDIALNPAYISRRVVAGKLWPVDWPALVSEADHYAAVRVLRDPERKTTRPGRAVWLLSYIATGACGGAMSTMSRGKLADGSPRKMYCCLDQCSAITVEKLDEEVTARLLGYVAQPEVHRELTRIDEAAEEEILGELAALDAELASWRALAGTGVDPTTIGAAVVTVNARIAEAKERRASMNRASGAVRALIGDGEVKPYEDLLATWEDDLGVAQRREIVRELFSVKVGRLKAAREPGIGVVGAKGRRIEIEPLTAR